MGFSQLVSLFIIVNTPRNAYSDPQCQRNRRVSTQCLRTFLPALLTVYSARTAFPCNNIGCITLIPCVRHSKSLVSLVLMFRHGKFSQCTTGNPPPYVQYLFRIWQAYLPIIVLPRPTEIQH